MFLKNEETSKILCFIRDAFGGICVGGGLYYAFTQFMLWYSNSQFSSYRGIDSLTPSLMIKSLPKSILACYNTFYNFFAKERMSIDTSITVFVLGISLLIVILKIISFLVFAFRSSFFKGMLMTLTIVLIPVASNASLLLAVGTSRTLIMSMGMMLTVILFVLLPNSSMPLSCLRKRVSLLVLALLLWISVSVVENDQLALKEGKNAVIALTETIVYTLLAEGYVTDGSCAVVFIGRPADSSLFYKSTAFEMANYYAKFGYFSIMPGNNQRTWSSVLYKLCGKKIYYADEETYGGIREMEEVANMPLYPQEGSIVKVGNIYVVKLAEPY